MSRDLVVTMEKATSSSQTYFLSNNANKQRLIELICKKFKAVGIKVDQANGDADPLIVSTLLKYVGKRRDVHVVSKDTDVLAMLIGILPRQKNVYVLHPPTSKVPDKLFDVAKIVRQIGKMKGYVLFAHAISGCDTTSAAYNKGKKTAWKALDEDVEMRQVVNIFNNAASSREAVIEAGENFMLKLYNGSKSNSLDDLRCHMFARALTRQTAIELETLPPTSAACKQHSLRVYLQVIIRSGLEVQEWLGRNLDPTDWGWVKEKGSIKPIPTELLPAPPDLLEMISCGCKQECGTRCSCRRAGLLCSMVCANCRGRSCCNGEASVELENSEDIDDPSVL
ncbi:hypothetical protein FOCC_FOCC014181 [Frankliniella occidentalis]|nr:hypothetical protein FOCC_FOCC014181 [Frankliniella occidentalis]